MGRDTVIAAPCNPEPPVFLIRSGFAYRACSLAAGRRAIFDVLVPGDIAGVDYAVTGRTDYEIVVAGRVAYQALTRDAFGKLLKNPAIAIGALSRLAEPRSRMDRLAAMIGELDARGRLATLLLDTYDRLRRRGLINQPTFKLPLTQEQIADHLGLTLVHVNRTLRRMREEGLVRIKRQIVMVLDLDGCEPWPEACLNLLTDQQRFWTVFREWHLNPQRSRSRAVQPATADLPNTSVTVQAWQRGPMHSPCLLHSLSTGRSAPCRTEFSSQLCFSRSQSVRGEI